MAYTSKQVSHTASTQPLGAHSIPARSWVSVSKCLRAGRGERHRIMVCFLTTAALNLLMQKWTKCPHPLPWSVPSPCTQRLARQLQLEGLETLDQLWGKLLEHSVMSHRRFGSPALRSPALAETDRCQEAPHTWSPYHPASCSSGTQAHLQPQAPPLPMHFNPGPGPLPAGAASHCTRKCSRSPCSPAARPRPGSGHPS